MTEVRKYHLMSLLVIILGVYLVLTEVTDRWTNLWNEYTSLEERRANMLDPEAALTRKRALEDEILTLRTSLRASSGRIEQSEPGTIESIDESARKSGILIETISPGKAAEGNVISLTAEAAGGFHGFGKFINKIENSPVAMRLEKLELVRGSGRMLKARLSVKATMMLEKEK